MNMARNPKFVIAALTVAFVFYFGSYWMVREANTVRHERDGCPMRGCEEVSFPGYGLYLIYAPLFQLDKFTDPGTEFYVVQSN
jgi:hypothetical protein